MSEANGLEALETLVGGMLAGVSPTERRRAMLDVARELRRENVAHIAAQRGPDGQPYAPRKPRPPARTQVGRIKQAALKQKMFRKIRLARYLKAEASPEEAAVGFADAAVARIARVHQLGLRDRVDRKAGSPEATYAKRVLIDFSPGSEGRILDALSKRLLRT